MFGNYGNSYGQPYGYQPQSNYGNAYGQQGFGFSQPQQPKTNIMRAYSREAVEAMSFELNSEMLVVDQGKPFVYLVSTDFSGVKKIQAFKLSAVDTQGNETTTQTQPNADLKQIQEDIKLIKDRLLGVNIEPVNKEKEKGNESITQ